MSGEIDFQNGFICGMATKGLVVNAIISANAFFSIGGKEVKLFSDGIQRTYGVLAYEGAVWHMRLARHFNPSFVSCAYDAAGLNAKGIALNAPQPSAAYQLEIT